MSQWIKLYSREWKYKKPNKSTEDKLQGNDTSEVYEKQLIKWDGIIKDYGLIT